MQNDNPVFSVRSLGNGTDYVIDVRWADGATEEVRGVFASPEDAARWVNDNGDSWVRNRGMKIHWDTPSRDRCGRNIFSFMELQARGPRSVDRRNAARR